MRDVAILGLSANPITLGHEVVALAVRAQTQMDVWLMPCYKHRFGKEVAESCYRVDMCGFVAAKQGFQVCLDEIRRKSNGSAYDTFHFLKKENPDCNFHLVIGTDNAERISEWDQGERFIEENPCIVVTRPDPLAGFTQVLGAPWYFQSFHKFVEVHFPVSSSEVRKAIRDKNYDYARGNVDCKVWKYIQENRLYGYEPCPIT